MNEMHVVFARGNDKYFAHSPQLPELKAEGYTLDEVFEDALANFRHIQKQSFQGYQIFGIKGIESLEPQRWGGGENPKSLRLTIELRSGVDELDQAEIMMDGWAQHFNNVCKDVKLFYNGSELAADPQQPVIYIRATPEELEASVPRLKEIIDMANNAYKKAAETDATTEREEREETYELRRQFRNISFE